MTNRKIGELIKKAREEKGLSQRQVAIKAGVSHSYLAAVERGVEHRPSPDWLKKVAKALDLNYENLLELAGYLEREEEPALIYGFNFEDLTEEDILLLQKMADELRERRRKERREE
jgi:transcriptional regulator with XRE-family HTH domain